MSSGWTVSYTPKWIFDIAVVRTASEFLNSSLPLESYAKKYSSGLSELYEEVFFEEVLEPAEEILRFLSDVKASHMAVEILKDFSYFRMYYVNPRKMRKLQPLFGTVEGPEKRKDYSSEKTIKNFRAYVFGLRSETVPKSPSGWALENEDKIKKLSELVNAKIGFGGDILTGD